MKNLPLLTVACITYNHEAFIRECLEGIMMQQADFPFEVIVHDDCSTDRTVDILTEFQQKYPRNIKLILQKENQYSKGKKPLIDFILPKAKGKYIAFCEGDDYWTDSNKIQKQVDILENHPDLSFCSHNVSQVDANSRTIHQGKNTDSIEYFTANEVFHAFFPTLSLVFRNVSLGYTDELKKALNGDSVLTGLLSTNGGAAHLGFNGANYRVHQGGVYRRSGYLSNQKRSIETRRIMLASASFNPSQKKEIQKNIRLRKKRSMKHALKKVKLRAFLEILFA